MFDVSQPFVLLDDGATGRATLFTHPLEIVVAECAADVRPALARLHGGDWAGFLGYEAGYALEPKLTPRPPPENEPLLWFARFADVVEGDALAIIGRAGEPARIGALQMRWNEAAHVAGVASIQALIAAGDIYQANLTFTAMVAVQGQPLAIYRALRTGSRAPYGALVFTGTHWLLSFSPELFFKLERGALTTRPMKGTAPRGGDKATDDARAAALAADPKNRAENLMIVDLLRNDLSRVATDVAVPQLFVVERYPTVLQMTSAITATVRKGIGAADVLAAMFPCGSVTGAPKIRAMEVIAETESAPRGVYTGSIGAVRAGGDAMFNVAIRTLVMPQGPQCVDGQGAAGLRTARLGLGSGIVADSEAAAEWQECLDKSAYLYRRGPPDLIETMRCEEGVLPDLEAHLARMAASADFLRLAFDPEAARMAVQAVMAGAQGVQRLRLLLSASGAMAVQLSPMTGLHEDVVDVAAVMLPVDAGDWRLRHKTSDRRFYDEARRAGGCFEAVLVRPDGLITEGSFTSVFVLRGGKLLTPPLRLGLLPGVLRARLIAEGRAEQGELRISDLGDGFFIGNALRGLMKARLARY